MSRVTESVVVIATPERAWQFYFDPRGWPAWVDGFASLERSAGYPEPGGVLVWSSTPAGRGRVEERVLEHAPHDLHRIAFADPESHGELETRFAAGGEETRVTLSLDYALSAGGVFSALTDRLFVRGQMRKALARTLERFKHEIEELGPPG